MAYSQECRSARLQGAVHDKHIGQRPNGLSMAHLASQAWTTFHGQPACGTCKHACVPSPLRPITCGCWLCCGAMPPPPPPPWLCAPPAHRRQKCRHRSLRQPARWAGQLVFSDTHHASHDSRGPERLGRWPSLPNPTRCEAAHSKVGGCRYKSATAHPSVPGR